MCNYWHQTKEPENINISNRQKKKFKNPISCILYQLLKVPNAQCPKVTNAKLLQVNLCEDI